MYLCVTYIIMQKNSNNFLRLNLEVKTKTTMWYKKDNNKLYM